MTQYTPIDSIPFQVQKLRHTFESGIPRLLAWRKQQLRALRNCLVENAEKLAKASGDEVMSRHMEIEMPLDEIDRCLKNLEAWISPEPRPVPLLQFPAKGRIYHDPLGVVCIIGAWNLPISMCLIPLAGAIAAGNCAVIKPSEVNEEAATALATLLPQYLDKSSFAVITGAATETAVLLEQRFDHIFYTGNGLVAKIIMKAAAEFLTPLTLELGGKNPCIIDNEVEIAKAVPRIVFGKCNNAGQGHACPDYVLIHKDRKVEFVTEFKKVVRQFYGEDPKLSPDYGKIINAQHTERILALLSGHVLLAGGKSSILDRYIEPTLVDSPDLDSPLMQEEIFGPVLPLITINHIDEAIQFVNARPKPLALYVFSTNKVHSEKVIQNTYFGCGAVNDTILQYACPDLPYGGVGASGMGAYHGKKTFETFSHNKSVLVKRLGHDPALRFPPFTESKLRWIVRLNKLNLPSASTFAPYLLVAIFAILVAFVHSRCM